MGLILISYWCNPPRTDYYSRHAERLKERCLTLDIPHDIEEVEDRGSWFANLHWKQEFIKAKMGEHGPVLWLDVDSPVGSNPMEVAEAALEGHDITFTSNNLKNYDDDFRITKLPKGVFGLPLRVRAMCHAWSGSPNCLRLVERWIELGNGPLGQKHGDHCLMQLAVDEATVAGTLDFAYFPHTIGFGPMIQSGLADGVPGRYRAMTRSMKAARK